MKKYEFIEHTADIKFKIYAKTLNEIFENAALAFSEVLTRGEKVKSKKEKTITLEGREDNEGFLYMFLDELVSLVDMDDFVTAKAKVDYDPNLKQLNATIYGDDTKNYKNLESIKAATYADMYIKKTKQGSEAQVVLDV